MLQKKFNIYSLLDQVNLNENITGINYMCTMCVLQHVAV